MCTLLQHETTGCRLDDQGLELSSCVGALTRYRTDPRRSRTDTCGSDSTNTTYHATTAQQREDYKEEASTTLAVTQLRGGYRNPSCDGGLLQFNYHTAVLSTVEPYTNYNNNMSGILVEAKTARQGDLADTKIFVTTGNVCSTALFGAQFIGTIGAYDGQCIHQRQYRWTTLRLRRTVNPGHYWGRLRYNVWRPFADDRRWKRWTSPNFPTCLGAPLRGTNEP